MLEKQAKSKQPTVMKLRERFGLVTLFGCVCIIISVRFITVWYIQPYKRHPQISNDESETVLKYSVIHVRNTQVIQNVFEDTSLNGVMKNVTKITLTDRRLSQERTVHNRSSVQEKNRDQLHSNDKDGVKSTFNTVKNDMEITADEFRRNPRIKTGNALIDDYGKNNSSDKGENGKGVFEMIDGASDFQKQYQINVLASDLIPLNRMVPDSRPKR